MTLTDRPWARRQGEVVLSTQADTTLAQQFHRSLPGYAATPLISIPTLAQRWGVASVHVKDESLRLGLPAFKILGASWAVNRAITDHLDVPPAATLAELATLAAGTEMRLVTATDGNHGRALAHMARLLGLTSRIYVPIGLPETTLEPIRAEGAEVIDTGAAYDDTVAIAAASTVGSSPGGGAASDLLIQDTAWDGYEQVPRWIIEGYETLFAEIDEQATDPASLVVVPTGVGSLLQAALERYRNADSLAHPHVLAVEPVTAACVTKSLAAGQPVSVDTSTPTVMAGLNCGTVSTIAWPAIRDGLDASIAVTDAESYWAAALLRERSVRAGPCGAATVAAVESAAAIPELVAALELGAETHVVLVSTDGSLPGGV